MNRMILDGKWVEKMEERAAQQNIRLFSRKRMELDGINEVGSLTDEQITLSSSLGMIAIEGHELKIESFSTESGELEINGEIDGVYYYGKTDGEKRRGLLSRLIK